MNTLAWQQHAACRTGDPNQQFPNPSDIDKNLAAKKLCHRCDVRPECLNLVVALGSDVDGVWGGLTERERRRLAAGNPLRACPACGITHVPADPATERCPGCSRNRHNPDADAHRRTVGRSRALVEAWLGAGHNQAWIARQLGVPRTTVTNAVARWRTQAPDNRERAGVTA